MSKTLKEPSVHFMGIGGSGASAVAAIAQARGFKISGCDQNPHNEFTRSLNCKGKDLQTGHSPNHLRNIDILAISPAIPSLDPDNLELLEAKKQGLNVLTWQEFMGKYLEKDKFVIAVSGTHGKSTTTAMIGQMLENAGLDPTVELGAIVPKWKANYRVGKSRYFVTEADEFNDNFLASQPDIAVVTTIEYDHPEYFKDFTAYQESFQKFLTSAKEKIIANMEDPGVCETLASHLLASHLKGVPVIVNYSNQLIDFPLQIPGQYNIMNASAAFQVGLALSIEPEVIKKSLASFTGTGRRFEKVGEYQGAQVISDFGHHPTEIKVTLQAAREKYPDQKIIVIFQPHMFSRTHTLFNDFVKVLQEAPVDQILIMDIYPSREVDTGLVDSKQLVEAIAKLSVTYLPKGQDVVEKLAKDEGRGEVLFFLGAGETHELAKKLVEKNG